MVCNHQFSKQSISAWLSVDIFVGSSDKLGTLYNVGNGVDGKGLPIDLNFSEICSLKIQEDKRGNQWAELQKEALNHYILNQ